MRSTPLLRTVLAIGLLLGGCRPAAQEPKSEGRGELLGLALEPSALVVRTDSSASFGAYAAYKAPDGLVDTYATDATWSSSDSSVLRVEARGRVRALRPGVAWVEAEAGGMRTAAAILVWRPRFFATVEAGSFYTCALDLSGEAYCWGHSVQDGRDGSGKPLTCTVLHFEDLPFEEPCSAVPVRVAAGLRFRALAVGAPGACALTAAGEAYCWRSTPIADDTIPNGVAARPVPVPGRTFASVSVGDQEICGVTPAGEVHCWKWTYQSTDSPPEACDDWGACLTTPELVAADVRFRSVSVGGSHVCGISERYEAYCWGFNWKGGVGVAEMGWVKRSRKITYDEQITSIAAALERTCAYTRGRDLLCWGGDWGSAPTKVIADQGIQLSAQTRQTCSLTSEGKVRCLEWTHSFLGQMSIPNQAYSLPGELRFAHISVGGGHICGIALEGDLYCWGGGNYHGELGHGSTEESDQPVKVIEPRRSSRQ